MAFTYAGTYDSDREKVRTNINDTVENAGPLPADANFSDALLAGIITAEGNWQRATAGCFEMLASAWNRYPSYSTDGLKLDRSDIADGFEKIAKKWRADFGYGERSYSPAMVAGQINIDGYSDDIANNAVTGNGDEYGGSFEYIVPG